MSIARFWPASLTARLTVLLIAALAIAQLALTFILRTQQDYVVEGLLHSQALNQTVTLARLLDQYPAAEAEKLAGAFGSRMSCSTVTGSAPPQRAMDGAEQRLAQTLSSMLHGVHAGTPQVAIETGPVAAGSCHRHGSDVDPADGPARDGPGSDHTDDASVLMWVPLLDGRWLTMQTTIALPGSFDRIALLSFALSAIAVAAVATAVVRNQTQSLRSLAAASDRLGRGETVAPLPVNGPSEVAAATLAFNTMQERLRLFLDERLRLLASISHDLRTPLTTLRLKAEFVEDEATRDDIVATIDELTTICEATLAFTRAEATTEETRRIDLRDLVEDVAADFRLAGAEVTDGEIASIPYACRPVALKRALRNLVENAVRYGGGARLSLSADGGSPVIAVEDRGPGLPPDRIEEAFAPFVRIEPSRSAETGGIGLGLAIARGIVGAHGGTLTLTNRTGGGLRAEIRLPAAS